MKLLLRRHDGTIIEIRPDDRFELDFETGWPIVTRSEDELKQLISRDDLRHGC